jgi:hypothetical protein
MMKFSLQKYVIFFDHLLENKLEALSENSKISPLLEKYNLLADNHQNIIKVFFILLSLSLPLSLAYFLKIQNNQIETDIINKEELINIANLIINEKSDLRSKEFQVFNRKVLTQNDISGKITSILRDLGIDKNNVNTNDITNQEVAAGIHQLQGKISFKSLSNDQLFRFMATLVGKEKIKIDEVEINLNKEQNLLEGYFNFIYIAKEKIDSVIEEAI